MKQNKTTIELSITKYGNAPVDEETMQNLLDAIYDTLDLINDGDDVEILEHDDEVVDH